MVWTKVALSTTSLETFNICFASGSTSSLPRTQVRSGGLESDWIIVSWERRPPFPAPFASTLNHGSLRDTLARSRVFRFPNTLETPRNEADKLPRPTQTQAQRYKSVLDHSVTQLDSWALSTLQLGLRSSCSRSQARKANASRNVSVDERNGRAGLRQPLKVKLSFYMPKARTNYVKNSFALAAVELWGSLPSCSKKETFLQNSRRRSGRTYYLSQPL